MEPKTCIKGTHLSKTVCEINVVIKEGLEAWKVSEICLCTVYCTAQLLIYIYLTVDQSYSYSTVDPQQQF